MASTMSHRRVEMTFTDEDRDLRFHLERSRVLNGGEVSTFFIPASHIPDAERVTFSNLVQQVQAGLSISDPLRYVIDLATVAAWIARQRFYQNPERLAGLQTERDLRHRQMRLQHRQQGGSPPLELRTDATEFVLAMQTIPHREVMGDGTADRVAGWVVALIFQGNSVDEENRIIEGGGIDEDMQQVLAMQQDDDPRNNRGRRIRRCHPRKSMLGVFSLLAYINSTLGPRASGGGYVARNQFPAHVRESVLRLWGGKQSVQRAFTSYLLQAGLSTGIRPNYVVGDALTLMATHMMASKHGCHLGWLRELGHCVRIMSSPPGENENEFGPIKRSLEKVLALLNVGGNTVVFSYEKTNTDYIMSNYLEDSVPVPPLTDQQRAFIRMTHPGADISRMSEDDLTKFRRLVPDMRFDERNIARFVESLRCVYNPLLARVTAIDALHIYEMYNSGEFEADRRRYIEFVRSRRSIAREICGRIAMYIQQPSEEMVPATISSLRAYGVECQTTGTFPIKAVKATPYTSAFQDQVHTIFSLLQMSCRLYKGFEIVLTALLHAPCVFFCTQDGMVLWNITLHDTEGDSGKSWKMRLIRDLLLSGTVREIGSMSSQALNYAGSSLMYCFVIIDELPRGFFEVNFGTSRETQGESEMSNALKAILSAGRTERDIVRSGDDGPRRETLVTEAFISFLGGTNMPKGSYSSAMDSRGISLEMADHQTHETSDVTRAGIVDDPLVQGKGTATIQRIVRRHQFLAMQIGFCESPEATTMNTMIYDIVVREFQKRVGVKFEDRDLIGRGLASAKMARIMTAAVQLFDTPLSPFNMTPENAPDDYFSKGYSMNGDMHKLQAVCGALTLEDVAYGISNIALKLKPRHEREIRLLVKALFSELLDMYQAAQRSDAAMATYVEVLNRCAPYLSTTQSSGLEKDPDYVFISMGSVNELSSWKPTCTDTQSSVNAVLMENSRLDRASSVPDPSAYRGISSSNVDLSRVSAGVGMFGRSSNSRSTPLPVPVQDPVRDARARERMIHSRIALAMVRALDSRVLRQGDQGAFERSIRSMTAQTTYVETPSGRVKKPIMKTQAGTDGSIKVCFLVEHLMKTVTEDPISTLTDILSELISVPERTFTVFGSEQRKMHPHLPRTLKVVRKDPSERTLKIPANLVSRSAMNPVVAANVAAMMDCVVESNGDLSGWRRYNAIFHSARVLNKRAVPVLESAPLPEGVDLDELMWAEHMVSLGITKDVLDKWGMRLEICNPRLFDSFYRQLKVGKARLDREVRRGQEPTPRVAVRVGAVESVINVSGINLQSSHAGATEYPECFMAKTRTREERMARRARRQTSRRVMREYDATVDGDTSDTDHAVADWARAHIQMRHRGARCGKEEADDDVDMDMSDGEDEVGERRHELGLRELFGAVNAVMAIDTEANERPAAHRVRERLVIGQLADNEARVQEEESDDLFGSMSDDDEEAQSAQRKRNRVAAMLEDEAVEEGRDSDDDDDDGVFVDDNWGISSGGSGSSSTPQRKRRRVEEDEDEDEDIEDAFGEFE